MVIHLPFSFCVWIPYRIKVIADQYTYTGQLFGIANTSSVSPMPKRRWIQLTCIATDYTIIVLVTELRTTYSLTLKDNALLNMIALCLVLK